jgi:hypothetical protein
VRNTEELIRAELFGIERLEQHAESLATAQRVTTSPGSNRQLPKRLHDNGRVLLEAYRAIAEQSARNAQSHLRRSGWSITFMSSRNRFAKFGMIFPAGSTANCLSLQRDHSKVIRVCLASPGPSLRIPIAASIHRCCAVSFTPINAYSL